MIFVTVGNATQSFARLLDPVSRLAEGGLFGAERVVVQSGNTPVVPSSACEYRPFLEMREFSELIRGADLVICHAGAGTLLHAIRAGRVPVVMPRRKMYGEHVDDHQLELVEALATEERLVPALEPEDLPDAIEAARNRRARRSSTPGRALVEVGRAIEELMLARRVESFRSSRRSFFLSR